jgi:methylenetetrahydrofolate dehydrogenase (NADP+) / methenyltetrahydrofolate cyclohydrolase
MAIILDGRALAQKIKTELKMEVAAMKERSGRVPSMVNIMIGEDHSTCAYANAQKKAADEIGIEYRLLTLPADIRQDDLIASLRRLNEDKSVNGIMLHKPVPAHINYSAAADCVDIQKDLEGINAANIGRMLLGQTKMIPCTPASVMAHIDAVGLELEGKEAVIVGHSVIVGKPLSLLMLNRMATVTVCHIGTSKAGRLREHVERADILVVAVGRPNLVPGAWIKRGAMVLDVGINRMEGGIAGDVDFDEAKERAGFITPVPGGIGPVTVVMLMRNSIEAFKLQMEKA